MRFPHPLCTGREVLQHCQSTTCISGPALEQKSFWGSWEHFKYIMELWLCNLMRKCNQEKPDSSCANIFGVFTFPPFFFFFFSFSFLSQEGGPVRCQAGWKKWWAAWQYLGHRGWRCPGELNQLPKLLLWDVPGSRRVGIQIPLSLIPPGSEALRNVRAELRPSEKLKYINPRRHEVECKFSFI